MEKNLKIFVGREYYLNILKENLENIKRGIGSNIALIGIKNIGKSLILKEFILSIKDKTIVPIYINLERAAISPEDFCINFVSNTCYYFKGGNYEDYKNIDFLLKLELGGASKCIKDLKNELEKIKPDHRFLVNLAFEFPDVLAKQENKTAILVIDEFQNILDLNNYDRIKNITSIFNSLSLSNVRFIVAGSAIEQMKEICKNFKIEHVGYLDFSATKKLILSIVDKISDEEIDRIFKLSLGHPYFITAICKRYNEVKNVDKAFIIETLSKQGLIYNSCNQLYNDSLNRARGKTLLISILNVLAYKDGLRLNEISRKIYRQSPVTKNLLSRLVSVDLIVFKDNKYYFSDPILKFWLKNILKGNEFDYLTNDVIEKMVKEIEI